MLDDARRQLLLELAVTLGTPGPDGGPPDDLFLPLIARRLGCRAAGILRVAGEDDVQTLRVAPHAVGSLPGWEQVVSAVRRADGLDRVDLSLPGECAHLLPLDGVGALALVRATPLPEDLLVDLEPVAGLLARLARSEIERVERERLLGRVEALGDRQRGLLDALPFPAWLSDRAGLVTEANAAFEERSTGAAVDVLGRLPSELLPSAEAELIEQLAREVLATGSARVVEERIPGSAEVARLQLTPYTDEYDRPVGVVGLRIDDTEQARLVDDLRFESGFRQLLGDLAARFINVPVEHMASTIDAALEALGTFLEIDRSYLFRYDWQAQTVTNTNEWVAEGISPEIDNLQQKPLAWFPDWLEAHLAGRAMHIPDVGELPAGLPTRAALEAQGIRTLLALPVQVDGECVGFVGFDSVGSVREWQPHEQQLLRVLAELIANLIERSDRERQLAHTGLELEAANLRLELAMRSGNGGVWDWDAGSGRTRLSAELMGLLGYPARSQEVDASTVGEFLPGPSYQQLLEAIQPVLGDDTERFVTDVQVRAGSGELRSVRIRGAQLRRGGELVQMAGTLEDRTQLLSEEARARRGQQLNSLLARRPSRLLRPRQFEQQMDELLGELGTIMDATHAVVAWLEPEQVVRSAHEWWAGERIASVEPRFALEGLEVPYAALAAGEGVLVVDTAALPSERREEREFYQRNGMRCLVTLPLFIEGELAGILGFDHADEPHVWEPADVAMLRPAADLVAAAFARRRAELELVRARREAERSDRAKTHFLSAISHELRTPMNGVLGMTELALADDLDEHQRRRISSAHDAARGLLGLLDDVLDVTRIQVGSIVLQPGRTDLHSLITQVTELAQVEASKKGLEIRTERDPGLPRFVELDEPRVRQVLNNLLSNAVKFTPSGWVAISARSYEEQGDARLQLVVEDTGPGIPEQDRERVMKPFVRLEDSESQAVHGTGLGLSIVGELVRLHGGRFRLQQPAGGGTRAIVDLPLQVAEAAPETSTVVTRELWGVQVLVAEDNRINQEVMAGFLAGLGCEMTLAQDGDEALRWLEKDTYDLVLLDCLMPGRDGMETARTIRARQDDLRHLPLVAVTADMGSVRRANCEQAGFDLLLAKPFSRQQLHAAISEALSLSPQRFLGPQAPVGQAGGRDETTPRLDPAALAALSGARRGGDGLLDRLHQLYEEYAPRYARQIFDGIADGDPQQVRAAAHTLRSNAATLGLQRLATACSDLEATALAAMDGGDADLQAPGARVLEEFEPSLAALRTALAAEHAGSGR